MSGGRRAEPGPFDVIADALDEPAGRATFMRGLMLGALVGAAVVGSVLRARQARRARHLPASAATEAVADEGTTGEGLTAETPVVGAEPASEGEPAALEGPGS